MKSDPSASSSDVEKARDLSRRLTGTAEGEGVSALPARPADAAGFFRFPRRIGNAAPLPSAAEPRDLPPPPVLDETGSGRWERLTAWLRESAGTDTAMLMDPHGLLMAVDGNVEVAEAESLGARLMAALDQAALMLPPGAPPPVLSVALAGTQLTGFGVLASDGHVLTVGLLGSSPVAAPLCIRIRALLERVL